MPTIFLGHGSPMNSIEKNDFTISLARLGESFPFPKAILMISAHWMTKGTWVTRMKAPKTIHDFHGFPKELFDIKYPAPGLPELADRIFAMGSGIPVWLDETQWGLDHGTWSVLKHMYPKADVPVVQLSLDMTKPPEYHYHLALQLRTLRKEGVLILGSGNIVHNLRLIDWELNAKPFDWAVEFDIWVRDQLVKKNHLALIHEPQNSSAGQMSIPTLDHYLPLLYVLGVSVDSDPLSFPYKGMQNGSISMRSVRFG